MRGTGSLTTTLVALAAVAALGLAGCGETTDTSPGWVATHPNTTLLTFDTTAPGLCAITVRYPADAPAAIGYLGGTYVQVAQEAHATPSPGTKLVDHSGDWQITDPGGGTLLLLTASSTYRYRLESTC